MKQPRDKNKSSIEKIKSSASCRTLYARFWPHLYREKGPSLAFCHDDSNPSCQVDDALTYCHACQKKFDVIDLFAAGAKLDNATAIRELEKELGLNNGDEPKHEDKGAVGGLLKQWKRMERTPLSTEAVAYLEEKRALHGIVKHLQNAHIIGFSAANRQWPASIAFPLTDWQRKTLQGIQYIPIGEGDKKFAKGTPAKDAFFRIDGRGGDFLVITEGIVDALSVLVACKRIDIDVGAILSAGFTDKLSSISDTPILFFDNDRAGQEATAKAVKVLNGHCRVVDWTLAPAGMKDVNDLLKAGHADVIEGMIRGSKLFSYAAGTAADPACTPIPFSEIEVPEFSKNILPSWAGAFACAVSEAIQVPLELAVSNILGVVSTAVAGKYQVEVKSGYKEPLNLYVTCALPPEERKSATLAACSAPLEAWEREKTEEMALLIRERESEVRTMEKVLDSKRRKAAQARTESDRKRMIEEIKAAERALPVIPTPPRLIADDVTPEQAAVLMSKNDERLAILTAEGGIFETLAGRYSIGCESQRPGGMICGCPRNHHFPPAKTILRSPHLPEAILSILSILSVEIKIQFVPMTLPPEKQEFPTCR
jgi:hypothetical protein